MTKRFLASALVSSVASALTQRPRPGSRSDAVLAQALDVSFNGIALSATSTMLGNDAMLNKLEELRRQMEGLVEERHALLASSLALTGGLSIGYIVWLVRGGVLLTSMLSALPAWQMIDPLPVLAAAGGDRSRRGSSPDGDDDPEVERLFDDRRAPAPIPSTTRAAPADATRPSQETPA